MKTTLPPSSPQPPWAKITTSTLYPHPHPFFLVHTSHHFKGVICEKKNVKSWMLINVVHPPGILQPLRGSHHPPDWPRPQGALPDDRLTQEVSQIILKSVCIIRWTSFSNATYNLGSGSNTFSNSGSGSSSRSKVWMTKNWKKLQLEIFLDFFFIKNCNLLIPRPP